MPVLVRLLAARCRAGGEGEAGGNWTAGSLALERDLAQRGWGVKKVEGEPFQLTKI